MPLTSDLTLDASKFLSAAVNEDTKRLNELLARPAADGQEWYNVEPAKYREMHENGQGAIPAPIYLREAKDASIPSREKGRAIPLRVYAPDDQQASKGILVHFHGGGFILGSHKYFDRQLREWANSCQLTAISVGYRLAPEDPHPAAVQDAFDAVEHLVDHGKAEYGSELLFLAGDSAGATLAVQSAIHLLRSRPTHRLQGVVAPYGYFDLTNNLPQVTSFVKPSILNRNSLNRLLGYYTPGKDIAARRDPSISPLYEDLRELTTRQGRSLPPALFLCGTEDPLLDDTLLMSVKWLTTGSEAIVKIYPGAPHGFTGFEGIKVAEESGEAIISFMNEKLAA